MGKSAVFHVTEANFVSSRSIRKWIALQLLSVHSAEPTFIKENGGKHVNAVGMSWFKAAIFIVADMMGAGMVALPEKLGQAGISSPFLLVSFRVAFWNNFTRSWRIFLWFYRCSTCSKLDNYAAKMDRI